MCITYSVQGRRRVVKSGPAGDMVECQRHDWGTQLEGVLPLLIRGVGSEKFSIN